MTSVRRLASTARHVVTDFAPARVLWNIVDPAMRFRLVACLTLLAAAGCRVRPHDPDDVVQIRALRGRSNRAIAAHDTAGIAVAWSDSIIVVASTGARADGRAANVR